MKDTLITARRKKVELCTMTVCFVVSFLLNWYAIAEYNAPYTELYSSIFYVLLFAVALYVAWTFLRLVVYGISRLFVTKKK